MNQGVFRVTAPKPSGVMLLNAMNRLIKGVDPRFRLSQFYMDPITLNYVACLDYWVQATVSVYIHRDEMAKFRSREELRKLVQERVSQANADLVAFVDGPEVANAPA